MILQKQVDVIHKKVSPLKRRPKQNTAWSIAQRSQEVYWVEFWIMGLFCMGLNTLNN